MIEASQSSQEKGGRLMGQVLAFPTRRTQVTKMQAPSLPLAGEVPAPSFTWEALERQLTDLAARPAQRALVQTLVSAIRKQANFQSPELVLREMLCIASVLMDETFEPALQEGEII